MSLFFIMVPATLLAAIFEKPKRLRYPRKRNATIFT